MFLAYKKSGNNLIARRGTEWQCRMTAKEIDLTAYNTWVSTITDADGVITYPSETFTIVEVTDEDVHARLNQLDEYVNSNRSPEEALVYNIKYYTAKRNAEEIKDFEGNSHSPKQYVSSHFVGDNTAKDARLLADKWVAVRRDRDSRLAETDYLALKDNTLSAAMKTHRQALRDVPSQSNPDSITWPTKP